LQSVLQTDANGVYFQEWTTTPAAIMVDVNLVLQGRATDLSGLSLADGFWQLISSSTTHSCAVTGIDLECPGDSIVDYNNIGGIVGKLRCTQSVGEISAYSNATFTVEC
jgi:hypothetical protein